MRTDTMKRNENVELATLAGMLHDLYTYKYIDSCHHARKGAVLAREILQSLQLTNAAEIDLICQAIHNHSSKGTVESSFDEVLKDAEVLQYSLFEAPQKHEQGRFAKLMHEIGISG